MKCFDCFHFNSTGIDKKKSLIWLRTAQSVSVAMPQDHTEMVDPMRTLRGKLASLGLVSSWFLAPPVLREASSRLQKDNYLIIDDFLGSSEVRDLRQHIRRLHR